MSRHRAWSPLGILVRVAALVVALVVVYVAITFVQVWRASGQDQAQPAQAIMVLGAAQYDGRPSPVLEARLAHALDLYEAGIAPLIVVSGGRQEGDRYTEATAGYNWLRERGVPDAAILKEVQGTTTWESVAAASRFLRERGVTEVVLVSEPAHALRLRGVADEVGLSPHVSPSGGELLSTGSEVRALLRETAAVSAGRVVGYRRLLRLEG